MTAGGGKDRAKSSAAGGSSTAPRVFGHVAALDGLRGIAVVLVMMNHGILLFFPSHYRTLLPGAYLGVDLFFVLSGFLITSLLLAEKQRSGGISYQGFYRRRALRLLPALFVFLTVYAIYAVTTHLRGGSTASSVAVVLLYVTNWWIATGHSLAPGLTHLWTLSVEEQFYIVWPIVMGLLLGARRSSRFAPIFLCGAISAVALWRLGIWHGGNFLHNPMYVRTDTRADSLLVGALAAFIWARGRLPRIVLAAGAYLGTIVFVACVAIVPSWQGFLYKGGFTLIAVAAAAIILATVDRAWVGQRVMSWSPLRATGRVSYGLYLWHLPVFFAVVRYGHGWTSMARALCAVGVTVLLTLMSYRYVEKPFLRRKQPRFTREERVNPA